MESFKNAVLQNLPKVYNKIKGDAEEFGQLHFIRVMTELLGYTPTEWEIDSVFQCKTNLTCTELKNIIREKVEHVHVKHYIHIAFLKMDIEHKGYITLGELKAIFDENNLQKDIAWPRVKENFMELSRNGMLYLQDFMSLFDIDDKFSLLNLYKSFQYNI